MSVPKIVSVSQSNCTGVEVRVTLVPRRDTLQDILHIEHANRGKERGGREGEGREGEGGVGKGLGRE